MLFFGTESKNSSQNFKFHYNKKDTSGGELDTKMENRNFVKNDDEFICDNCGRKVPKLGYSSRNHCPYCLHSKHVDIKPGDRMETCHRRFRASKLGNR